MNRYENTRDIKYKVVEIFDSIEGEGARTGLPATFIRLYFCPLHCSYCDSRYACEGDNYKEMTIYELAEELSHHTIPNITLTGGEPLYDNSVYTLIEYLLSNGYNINIETNGNQNLEKISKIRSEYQDYGYEDIIITMDWKCKSSGMTSKMIPSNLSYLSEKDVLKFVVGNKEDLDQMEEVLKNHRIRAQVFVSPVFGKIEPKEIVEYILSHQLYDVKTQVQLHKIIYDPEMRGV